ncbi:MAG: DegT/DnrJ/EryC1/StrS family aminotransferase [Phycisphaerae bacterium]
MTREQTVAARLAIEGGKPVRDVPLPTALGGAMIGEEEKRAVLEVLESRSLFRYYGPHLLRKVERLEEEFAPVAGCAHALAVSSGTAALRTALIALEIGRGDEVLMPAYSFLACPAAVMTCGAIPVFVECDESLLLDSSDLEARITPRTRAILVVHNNGAASAMEPILDVARRHDLRVIEDCAQALGATYLGRPVGSFGDIATFSLQYLKLITSGEGGVLTTNDAAVYQRAVFYHDLGFQRPGREGHPLAGENYRMSELTGAVALEQLRKLPIFLERIRECRQVVVGRIGSLDGVGLRNVPDPDGDQGSSLVLQFENAEKARFFRRALRVENIPCDGCFAKLSYGYHAILGARLTERDDRQEFSKHADGVLPYRLGLCPRTEAILKRSVAITISPAYSDSDVDDIARAIVKVAAHLPC